MVPWLKPTSASAEGGKVAALELGIEEALEHRRRLVDADPALVRIAEGEREPLLADRRLAAGLRRMRGDERRVGSSPCQARPMSMRSLPSAP